MMTAETHSTLPYTIPALPLDLQYHGFAPTNFCSVTGTTPALYPGHVTWVWGYKLTGYRTLSNVMMFLSCRVDHEGAGL